MSDTVVYTGDDPVPPLGSYDAMDEAAQKARDLAMLGANPNPFEAMQSQIEAQNAKLDAQAAQINTLNCAIMCLDCPDGYRVTDPNTMSDRTANVEECTRLGMCDCDLGHCMTTATWQPSTSNVVPAVDQPHEEEDAAPAT